MRSTRNPPSKAGTDEMPILHHRLSSRRTFTPTIGLLHDNTGKKDPTQDEQSLQEHETRRQGAFWVIHSFVRSDEMNGTRNFSGILEGVCVLCACMHFWEGAKGGGGRQIVCLHRVRRRSLAFLEPGKAFSLESIARAKKREGGGRGRGWDGVLGVVLTETIW